MEEKEKCVNHLNKIHSEIVRMSGSTTNSFFTQSHVESVRGLLQKYIEQNKKIYLTDYWNSSGCTELLHQAMRQVIMEIKAKTCPEDLGSINKRIMTICIPAILSLTRTNSGVTTNNPSNPNIGRILQSQTVGNGVEGREIIDMNPEEVSLDKDRLFMEKLQELEMTRNVPLLPQTGASGSSGTISQTNTQSAQTNQNTGTGSVGAGGIVENGESVSGTVNIKSSSDVLLPQVHSASIPTSISTVFMPMPPRKGHELLINSWQRNWLQYPQRNSYAWNGPIPQGIDWTLSRVSGVLLPRLFLRKSPYMVLHMEGAGNTSWQAILVPDAVPIEYPWILYRPLHNELGYIKALACPWTIKIYTANGRLVPMGKDGDIVTIIGNGEGIYGERIEMSKETIMTVQLEDQLWIFGPNGDIFLCEVTHIQKEQEPYWISYESDESPKFNGKGNMFNFSQQWSLLIDMHRAIVTRN